jgi:hypothetical protein
MTTTQEIAAEAATDPSATDRPNPADPTVGAEGTANPSVALEFTITEPGIYDIPDATYHADPVPDGSLSNTEARRILECPARYRWDRDNRQAARSEFEFGHAAHLAVLGTGADVVVCDFDDWRTKDAKTARDDARAAGKSPVLSKDWVAVEAMVAALKAHPIACALLTAAGGRSEQSMFWQDTDPFTQRSVWLRGRLDRLPATPTTTGRLIVADYKTAAKADRDSFSRSAASYGYHQQAAWYIDGIKALCDVDDPAFVFVVQEKHAPYLVNVIELDTTALDIGRARNRAAIDRWIECIDRDEWPGYSTDVELVALPRWAELAYEQENQ